ncbi:hypothetical protein [Companilactobacillus paralimentarius]|uniref:hypothetical protein n=1 Tax=Companilactobacillus paralimentarius TaxID=83526 RepID=UPI00384F9D9B
MALETIKTTYLNGSSKDGNRVLANFSSSLSESGTMTINETISESTNLDTVEADFNEFRELAKNELKKLNAQDTETDVSSDKPVDKEVPATTSDNEVVKDDKPVSTSTKTDNKPDTSVSSDKPVDKEVVTPTSNDEAVKDSEPVGTTTKVDDKPETNMPDETKVSDVKDSEEVKQPVVSEEIKQPTSNEEIKQPVSTEENKQPVSNEEAKISEVKDGENVDESN